MTPTTQDKELQRRADAVYNVVLDIWGDVLYTTFKVKEIGLQNEVQKLNTVFDKLENDLDKAFKKFERFYKR